MAKSATALPPAGPITPTDLENKFRGLQEGISGAVEDRKRTIVIAAAAGATVLLLAFFFLGKRSGKKRRTVVEIRRL
ncbi:MAG: hypothetical protein H0X61_06975 [Acidimicrobiia bacterium]|jgi:hypothetical protein|nr:hypothetical protein [Acidimicrobiia bacterium]MBA3983264.1 hypothetical protein [Acidimicrobiia bacterium]MDQ3391077.1 hypothetical protein [Actinomycetota bacterium]